MNKNLYWPGGNPTLLIEDLSSSISPEEFSSIATQYLSDEVEQVGFIRKAENADLRLEMMGGEFCVNAVRCLALWNYERTGKTESLIECSGSDGSFRCKVENLVAIEMPKKHTTKLINEKNTLVKLDGIAHFVYSGTLAKNSMKKELKRLTKAWSKEISGFPAVGLIALDVALMKPLVYVKETGSMIIETACGSGAIAAFIAGGQSVSSFIQPSGSTLIVSANQDSFILKGEVINISQRLTFAAYAKNVGAKI